MSDDTKPKSRTVRLSDAQWERAVRAAQLETDRTGRKVYPTVLLTEIGMDGIDAIIEADR